MRHPRAAWVSVVAVSAGLIGVALLAYGLTAERRDPTQFFGGGFLGPPTSAHATEMHWGYWIAVCSAIAATWRLRRTRGRVAFVLVAVALAPLIAAALLVQFWWPPLSLAAYGGYDPASWPQRPWPWKSVDVGARLAAAEQAPDLILKDLRRYRVSEGVAPADAFRALERAHQPARLAGGANPNGHAVLRRWQPVEFYLPGDLLIFIGRTKAAVASLLPRLRARWVGCEESDPRHTEVIRMRQNVLVFYAGCERRRIRAREAQSADVVAAVFGAR